MKKSLIGLSAAALLVSACATEGPSRRVWTGAGIGAATGAGLGTLAGGNDGRNAAIGAAVGALAGAAVGDYMDRQERALKQRTAGTGIEVVRQGDQIQLVAPSDITFALNSADISPSFYPVLNDVAMTLKEFPSTAVDIVGHASADGPADYNQQLSERRANSVLNYLGTQGVRPVRIQAYGMGETQLLPGVAPESGANRRVEITLTPIVEQTS
ncbi:OmpA family protein [Ponticaulis profundi]|uniref:OmpA family protein n=1 Tax=Ponticaulis profundi TaxID=2665222 RepID=A0ABW1SCR9_9PROT